MSEETSAISEKKERVNIKAGIVITYLRLAVYLIISVIYPPRLIAALNAGMSYDVYGLYQFAMSIATWVLLLSFGIENSYVRFATLAEKEGGEDALKKTNGFYLIVFSAISLLELIVGLSVAFLYQFNVIQIAGYDDARRTLLSILIIITIVSQTSDFLMSFFTWFIYYRSRFIWQQTMFLIARIVTVGVTLGALAFGANVVWVAAIAFIVQFVMDAANVAYSLLCLKERIAFPGKTAFRSMLKEVTTFSLFLFLIIVVNQVNTNLGKTALGHLDVEDVNAVTVFGFGLQFYDYENLIATAVSNNFAPKVNRLAVNHQDDQVKSYFLRVSHLQMIILFLIVGGFASCGQDFVTAWLGDSGLGQANLDKVYYIALAIMVLWLIPFSETLGNEIQKAYNQHKFLAIVNLIFAVVNIALTIGLLYWLPSDWKIFAPVFGMAVAVVSGNIIVTNVYYAKKMALPVGHFFLTFALALLITAVSFGAVYAVYHYGIMLPTGLNHWVSAIIKGLSFVVLYIPLTILLFRKQFKGYLQQLKDKHQQKDVSSDSSI